MRPRQVPCGVLNHLSMFPQYTISNNPNHLLDLPPGLEDQEYLSRQTFLTQFIPSARLFESTATVQIVPNMLEMKGKKRKKNSEKDTNGYKMQKIKD